MFHCAALAGLLLAGAAQQMAGTGDTPIGSVKGNFHDQLLLFAVLQLFIGIPLATCVSRLLPRRLQVWVHSYSCLYCIIAATEFELLREEPIRHRGAV